MNILNGLSCEFFAIINIGNMFHLTIWSRDTKGTLKEVCVIALPLGASCRILKIQRLAEKWSALINILK